MFNFNVFFLVIIGLALKRVYARSRKEKESKKPGVHFTPHVTILEG